MHDFDYTFEFGNVGASETQVHITNHRDNRDFWIRAQIDDRNAFKEVRRIPLDTECASDVFTLAALAQVVDRMAVRRGDEVCRIRVMAPAWRPEVLASAEVSRCLREALFYYTGDVWQFDWRQREKSSQRPHPQFQADWGNEIEVALWSGGLDSGAGVINRFEKDSTKPFLLVGTGASDSTLGVQRQTFRAVSKCVSNRVQLVQVPIHIIENSHLPRASSGRARGFVFTLIGAVCAYLQNQTRLHIYENGIGAINLPYCAAEVGLDHARSVHPAALSQISTLLKLLLDEYIAIYNPFLFTTKAELCRPLVALAQLPHLADSIWKTVSCDSPHRQADTPPQCGYCTSCVLRRQALAVNGIADLTPYAIHYKALDLSFGYPLRVMLHQVETIKACFQQSGPWRAFREEFPDISSIFTPQVVAELGTREAARESVLQLYRNYSMEWNAVPNEVMPWLERQHMAA